MKRSLTGVCLSALIALALPAKAIGHSITFTQTTPGTVSAVLAGSVDPCSGPNIFPMGVSSVSLSGNRYDIASTFAILDPPPTCPFSQPYSVSTSLGAVPDGQYTVVWTAGPLVVTGAFSVRSGLLLGSIPVPTLDRSTMILLITVIAGAALALIRRNP